MAGSAGTKSALVAKRRRQREFKRFIAPVACAVVVFIAAVLMLPAISMTRGEVVCGFEEHAHAQACYEQALVCGLEEGKGADPETGEGGHVHGKGCYEKQLVCDIPEHEHVDGCFAPEPEPDPEPVNDAQVADIASGDDGAQYGAAGPDYAVQNDESAADINAKDHDNEYADSNASGEQSVTEAEAMPAQSFTADLKYKDGTVAMTVNVEAPEGAFPAGTHMKIDGVAPDAIRDKVAEGIDRDEKLAASLGGRAAADCMSWLSAVDVRFTDADANELVAAKKCVVRITAPEIHDLAKPVLVRAIESKETKKLESAEVIRKVKRVNADEKDEAKGHENTLKFKATEFTTFAIVGLDADLADGANADAEDEDANDAEPAGGDGAEPAEAVVPLPAASFKQDVLDADGNTALTVEVEAPEGALPEGATMKAELVTDEEVIDAAKAAAADAADVPAKRAEALAADITFLDAEGDPVEPKADVHVTMTAPAVAVQDQLAVVHVDAETNASVVDAPNVDKKQETVAFDASEFSAYVLVYATISKEVLTANGETYEITVAYGADAQIPDEAELKVREIVESDEEYADLIESSIEVSGEDAMSQGIDLPVITKSHLFDIEIHGEKGKVEPKAPVQVDVKLSESKEDAERISVVHFGETGPEAMSSEEVPHAGDADIQEVRFEADSFSVYTVQNVTSLDNYLNNAKYALVSERGTGITSADGKNSVSNYAMIGSISGGTLAGKGVYKDGNTVGGYVTEWGFESVGSNQYRIFMMDGDTKKYVTASGDNLVLSETATSAGLFTASVSNNKIRFSNNGRSITSTGNNPSQFKLTNLNGDDTLFNLCEVDPNYEEQTAKKVSAADWKAAEGHAGRWDENATVVIYRRIEHADGSEELYALATDGSLVPVYDGGDSIFYHCPEGKNVNWHIVLGASGYYISNVIPDGSSESTVYLAPSVTNGTWNSDSPVGLVLGGMGSDYGTTIENWDQAAYAYAGLHVDATDAATLGHGVTPGSGATSDTFLFAVSDTLISEGELHTVDTVDSTSKGITMKIFNYGGGTYNYGYRNSAMQGVMGDDMLSDWDNRKSHVTRTVTGKLGEDGFPVSLSNGNSYAPLFTLGDGSIAESGGDANNLFLQSYYDENGMFRYSSMENFAHYSDGNFTVYREAGTPNIPTANDHYYYYHGHFMPYNTLDTSVSVSRIVDQYGSITDKEMGRSFENVYGLSEAPDYYVGMSLEAKFVQPSGGTLENGDPVVYRFTGDDDLLVYIDGILVLDVGGIHEPLTGSINFETGVITQPNFYGEGAGWQTHTTTLYEVFRKAYRGGLISDEDWAKIKWVDVDGDGTYDTFADHTTHNFNMFYLERGAGASNLDLQFNLQVVKKDEFTVRKNLPEDVKPEFVNQTYKFIAYFIDDTEPNSENKKKLLYPGAKKADGTDVCSKVVYADLKDATGQPVEKSVPFDSQDHSFTLRAGEAAVFSMASEEIVYDVYEVDIDGNLIEQVDINGASTQIDAQSGPAQVGAGEESVENRSEVNVINHPLVQDLRITKHITDNSLANWEDDNPVFEFRVYLEQFVTDENGDIIYEDVEDPATGASTRKPKTKLVPYARSPYYLVKIPAGQENNEEAWEYYTLTGENNAPVLQPHGTVCSITGRSGTINSIPPEYTIIIPDLAVGTHFYVEERRATIPEGYEFDHEALKEGTYDESALVIDGNHIDQIMTIDAYSNDEAHYFDADSVGRIKNEKDAEFDVWNRKPSVEIPVEKIWEDNGTDGRPDNVTLALIRYKPQSKYTPEQGKGAIIIDHVADYGQDNDSTELPAGFVATYAIEKHNATTGEYEVVVTGTSGPFDVDPGEYRVSTVVNNRGNEPVNYTYYKTDPVVVNVQENQSTVAEVKSEYNYEQGGKITIAHKAAYEGGDLAESRDLPEGFVVTYTIKDEATNRIVHRNVGVGEYDVPAGTYTVTANVSDPAEPGTYVYRSTSTAEHVAVTSGGEVQAELTSSYVYVAPKTYGYITVNHASSGLTGVSPNLPDGIQVTSYRIVGPTTINNAQLGQEYQVEAGEYTVIANVNFAPEVDGFVYIGTSNVERVIGTNQHETVTLTSEYAKHGEIVISHSYAGLPEGTTPSGFSAQYSIVNAAGETVRSHVAEGTYPVPAGDYTVQVHVYGSGSAPEGYFYLSTPETVAVTVPSEGTVTANVVSTYGANGSITIEHKSSGLAGSPDALPSTFQVQYTIVDAEGHPVQGCDSVAAGTYTVAPGNYTVRTSISYQEPPTGYTYANDPSTTDVDEGTPEVNVTVESGQNTIATVISYYNPPSYLTFTLSGTWADGNVPTSGSVTVPILDAWSNSVGSFTLNPENNWTGTVSLMSGGGHGTYKLDTNNVAISGTGVNSIAFNTTSLSDTVGGTFTYNGVAKPTTATVYLHVGTSPNEGDFTLIVPKGSTMTLSYHGYQIDQYNTLNPGWKLYYKGQYSWNNTVQQGGMPEGGSVDISIGDEDVYCVMIEAYAGSALDYGATLVLKEEPTANAASASPSWRVSQMPDAIDEASKPVVQNAVAAGAKAHALKAQKPAKLSANGARGAAVSTTVDPATVSIPESVSSAITELNASLVDDNAGYEYVLDPSFGKQVVLSDPWTYTFEGLEELGTDGHPYYYALVEVEVPTNYTVSYADNNPVSASDIRANMDARAAAEAAGDTLPALVKLSATNTKVVGDLEITKKIMVNGGLAEQNDFPSGTYAFPVLITTVIDETTYYVQDANGTLGTSAPVEPLTVTAGSLGEAGSPLTISNLPFGTYSVTEIQPDSVEVAGYSFVVKEAGPQGDVHFESITSDEGTIENYQTPGSVSLVNYYMKGASWTPEVDKWLNGMPHSGEAEGYSGYTFTLSEPQGQNTIHNHPGPGHEPGANNHTMSATTGADGKAVFGKIDFGPNAVPGNQESKDYHYTITENRPADAQAAPYIADFIQYDAKTIYVKVTVSKQGNGNNRVMNAQAHYYSDADYTQPLTVVDFDNIELGSLTVAKAVTGEDQATDEDRFPFTIMKDGQYVVASANETTYTYVGMSSTNPEYTIQKGQTLTFQNLPVGTYVVTEGAVNKEGYLVVATYKVNNESAANGTTTVQKGESSAVEITNNYTVSAADLVIVKLDSNGMTIPLEGASFSITPIDETASVVNEIGDAVTGATTGKDGIETGEDGKVQFSDLANGYYIVKEVKTPAGYVQTGDGCFFIRVESGVVKLVERDGTGWKEKANSDDLVLVAASGSEPANIKVGNTPGSALPHTGGPGATAFYLLGIALMGVAYIGLVMKRRKESAV